MKNGEIRQADKTDLLFHRSGKEDLSTCLSNGRGEGDLSMFQLCSQDTARGIDVLMHAAYHESDETPRYRSESAPVRTHRYILNNILRACRNN